MNSSHYPSLELCKKLTEIGFPETEKQWRISWFWKEYILSENWIDTEEVKKFVWVCPSIMEMLDVIPQSIKEWVLQISHDCHDDWSWDLYWAVEYSAWQSWSFPIESCDDDKWWLPNALAAIVIWLHQNNYISFNK